MTKLVLLAMACVVAATIFRRWFVAGIGEDPYTFREPRQR
jgi:hypothetical protein